MLKSQDNGDNIASQTRAIDDVQALEKGHFSTHCSWAVQDVRAASKAMSAKNSCSEPCNLTLSTYRQDGNLFGRAENRLADIEANEGCSNEDKHTLKSLGDQLRDDAVVAFIGALLSKDKKDFAKAEKALKQLVDHLESENPRENADTQDEFMGCLDVLADTCMKQGKYKDARNYYQKAADFDKERPGKGDYFSANVLMNQGKVESCEGNWDKAIEKFDLALGMLDKIDAKSETGKPATITQTSRVSTLVGCAQALDKRGSEGDKGRAFELRARAEKIAKKEKLTDLLVEP